MAQRSLYRYTSREGNTIYVSPTERDYYALRYLSRISTADIPSLAIWVAHKMGDKPTQGKGTAAYKMAPSAAYQSMLTAWNNGEAPTVEAKQTWDAWRRNITVRLGKIVQLEKRGSKAGPWVEGVRIADDEIAYHPTQHGATLAEAKWAGNIAFSQMRHATRASHVAAHLACLGIYTLTEREVRSRHLVDGTPTSNYITKLASADDVKSVLKIPDQVIPGENGQINIEVEMLEGRPTAAYKAKMSGYRGDSRVKALWFICRSAAISRRIERVRDEVYADGRGGVAPNNVRVMTIQENPFGGLWVHRFQKQPGIVDDLRAVRPVVLGEAHKGELAGSTQGSNSDVGVGAA